MTWPCQRQDWAQPMKKRMHQSWKLVRTSWLVLLRHRMLLVYPLLSSFAVSYVALYVPLALVRARLANDGDEFSFTPQGILGFLILYLATCTTVQIFNVMLVADAVARFDGQYRMRLKGWRVVLQRFPTIVAYAVLSSTLVSLPIMVVCRIGRLFGGRSLPEPDAWSLQTFLGVPLIAVERLDVRSAMQRSETLLRTTWGNTFVGGTGVLVVRILVVVSAFLGGIGVLFLVSLVDYDPLTITVVFLWLAVFLFLIITGAAVSTIFCTATYRHCIGRPIPGFEALSDLPISVPSGDSLPESAQPETAAS